LRVIGHISAVRHGLTTRSFNLGYDRFGGITGATAAVNGAAQVVYHHFRTTCSERNCV
jgi:hypothetical protein